MMPNSSTPSQAHHCCSVHNGDIETRITHAKELCTKTGGRFTPLREQVYRLILAADKPLGAYDLVSQLQLQKHATGNKANVAPPTVYRSLEFLLQFHLIHQLNSINAYVPCCHPRAAHVATFLLCTACHGVQELSDPPVRELVAHSSERLGFCVQETMIELSGLCRACQ